MLLSHTTMRRAHRRVDEVLNACSSGGIGNIFPLPDLAFKTDAWQPEILHAEDSICAFERCSEFCTVFHIAWNDFGTKRGQFLRGWFVCIACERAYLPTIR